VTRRGKEAVVILSVRDYRKMRRPDSDLVSFLRRSPLYGLDLELERPEDDTGRDLEEMQNRIPGSLSFPRYDSG
jgi:PHD/YefM family antitoxin component YafN of YafNO toxin-antitoxin module